MVIINDIYAFLNEIAPVRYQMDFDNAGFLVGDGGTALRNALLALDITDAVIAEAIELRAQLIVSHHPLIFTPLRHATTDDLAGRKVLTMARHGISAICMHTNLDAADGGVNDALAEKLGLLQTEYLTDEKIGRVGTLKCQIPLVEFTRFVVKSLGCNGLRYTDCGRPVHRVAVGGGACGEYIAQAIALGCDTFVTSDLRYHDFLDTKELNLIDAGHFPTEQVIIPELCRRLQAAFSAVSVSTSISHQSEVIQYCI